MPSTCLRRRARTTVSEPAKEIPIDMALMHFYAVMQLQEEAKPRDFFRAERFDINALHTGALLHDFEPGDEFLFHLSPRERVALVVVDRNPVLRRDRPIPIGGGSGGSLGGDRFRSLIEIGAPLVPGSDGPPACEFEIRRRRVIAVAD